MAIKARPTRPADEIARRPVERRRAGEAEEIEPLIGVERQAERGVRLRELQAHRAAGIGVEPLVDEDLRRSDSEREGRQRQIEAAEPESGKAEQKAGDEAHDAGQRNGRPVRQAEFRYQNRRPIAANGEEGAVTERNLAVVSGQQIEPQKSDGEDQHLLALVEMIAGGEERKDKRENRDCERDNGVRRPASLDHAQTRATRRRPNRPEGRQTRTAMMIASATESLTSSPTT